MAGSAAVLAHSLLMAAALSAPLEPLQRAKDLHHQGKHRQALELAEALREDPRTAAAAAALVERIRATRRVHPARLGVALPVSGRYRNIGRRLARVMKWARPPGLEWVVADTEGTPEGAAAAVERLVTESFVVGIIGPVGDRESAAAAQRATELKVPILTLSTRPATPSPSPWVFRLRFSPWQQGAAVAHYAHERLGISAFAVLGPDDLFGREALDGFWSTVLARGGEIRGAAQYRTADGQRGYDEAVREVIGGFPRGVRQDAFEVGEGKFKGYRPIVDFEALFIADHPGPSLQVLRSLTYYDVAIRRGRARRIKDPDTGRLHSTVDVLGTGAWNHPSLVRGGPPEIQGAVFCDVFDRSDVHPSGVAFIKRARKTLGRPASSLEAQAFGAMTWWGWAWSGGGRSRAKLRRRLLGFSGRLPALGEVTVGPHGAAELTPTCFGAAGESIVHHRLLVPSGFR